MERTEVLDMMGELKLYGMKAAYDETLATALKRQHDLQRFSSAIMSRMLLRSMVRRSSSCRSERSRRPAHGGGSARRGCGSAAPARDRAAAPEC